MATLQALSMPISNGAWISDKNEQGYWFKTMEEELTTSEKRLPCSCASTCRQDPIFRQLLTLLVSFRK